MSARRSRPPTGPVRAGAHDEQATFLQIACDLLPPGDERRADLLGRGAVALAWALRFDDAVAAARAAAEAGSGPAVVAEVATVLATAGSNTHAWQLAAAAINDTTGPAVTTRRRWAALTLLDLDRREAADPAHPGMPLDLPGRRAALRILHESGRLARRGDLARYAVAAVHGRRDRIPAVDAADPTVAAFLLGDYTAAVPLFAREADAAEAHGQLAWAVTAVQARPAARSRWATSPTARSHSSTRGGWPRDCPGLALGWQLLHHQGAEDALAMALDEGWPERMATVRAVDGPRSRPALGQSGHRAASGPAPGAHGPHRCRALRCSPVRSTR